MANTTNYSWETPDDTDLVKDGAAAIRTLGSAIDTTTKALNPSTTLGDIEYRSSTANTNTRLGIGSTGQVLTVAGGVPSWATPAGGGKVLQVVSATYSTAVSVSTTTFTDTGLSASITPSSTSSKILVLYSQQISLSRSGTYAKAYLRLLRGATAIWTIGNTTTSISGVGINVGGTGGTSIDHDRITTGVYLDSPATTSSTTYKMQGAVINTLNSHNATFQLDSIPSQITLMEIGA